MDKNEGNKISLADAAQRKLAEESIGESMLLDAGAGTGKTDTLIKRIMNIVRSGGARLREIVAITFTEKAAGELKFRLRQELDKAASGAAGKESEVLQKALADLDTAHIGTIHSFAASLLRERPAEARVDPRFEVADQFEANLLREDTWENWFSKALERGDEILREAYEFGISDDAIKELAFALSDNRDFALAPDENSDYPVAANLVEPLGKVIESLEKKAALCIDTTDDVYKNVQNIKRIFDESKREANPLEFAKRALSFEVKGRGSKKRWNPPEAKDEAATIVSEAHEAIRSAANVVAALLSAKLLQWLDKFAQYYGEQKEKRALIDFHDILLRARDMLKRDKRARDYFQRKYRRILVDEFQDTDPLQAEIVFFLAEDGAKAESWDECRIKPGKLFIVGDPKQSIYAFRRADLDMYRGVREKLLATGKSAQITVNFRTVPAIIDWVNAKFGGIIADYEPIVAARPAPEEKIKTGVWRLAVAEYDKLEGVDEQRAAEADTIAEFITKAVGNGWPVYDKRAGEWRPLGYGDVALLFLKRTGLNYFEDALNARSIPYVAPGSGAFFAAAEVMAILDCLVAIDRPDNPVALVGALRSPFFGFSDEEIFLAVESSMALDYTRPLPDGKHASGFRNAFALLNELHEERNGGRIAALVEKFYRRTLGPPIFLVKPIGDQRLANLFKVIDRARRFDAAGARTFGTFVKHLMESEDWGRGEEQAPAVEEGDRFVRLMTIHGSKGLEFPMVILADMTSERKSDHKIIFDRRSGGIEMKFGNLQSAGFDAAFERERERYSTEDKHLLYVACTRARDYLVIPKPDNGEPKKYTAPLAGIEKGEHIYEIGAAERKRESQEIKPFRFHGEPKKGKRTDEELARFNAWRAGRGERLAELSRPNYFRSVTDAAKCECTKDKPCLSVPPNRQNSPAMKFGSFVHALMTAVDFNNPGDVEKLARTLAAGFDLGNKEIEEATAMVKRALESEIISRARASKRLVKEYPFLSADKDGFESGRADLVFIEGGKLVIVDYKTDKLSSEQEAALKISESYHKQGRKYAAALSKITGTNVKETVFLFLHPDPPIAFSAADD